MDEATASQLKKLIEARDNVQRQIEEQQFIRPIINISLRDRPTQIGGVLAELRETLRQLDECIAGLQALDAQAGPAPST